MIVDIKVPKTLELTHKFVDILDLDTEIILPIVADIMVKKWTLDNNAVLNKQIVFTRIKDEKVSTSKMLSHITIFAWKSVWHLTQSRRE